MKREENALTTFVEDTKDPENIALKEHFIKEVLGEVIKQDTDQANHEEARRENGLVR